MPLRAGGLLIYRWPCIWGGLMFEAARNSANPAIRSVMSSLFALLLTIYAKHAPRIARRGKVFRLLATFCEGKLVTSRFGVRMHVDRQDRTNQLCILGRYETVPAEVDRLAEGMCFIDIGANAGLFSLMAAKRVGPTGLVIAFEPSPAQFARLVANIRENGGGNILPMQLAIADQTAQLDFSGGNPHHTGKNHVYVASDREDPRKVVGVNLSEDFTAVGKIISTRSTVIKIDVEGFEHQVLIGIDSLLRLRSVVSVIVELDDECLARYGSNREEIFGLMREHGFTSKTATPGRHHDDLVFERMAAAPCQPAGAVGIAPPRDEGRTGVTQAGSDAQS